MDPVPNEAGDPVPNAWILTWWMAWTRGNGGRPFFDHESGRLLWKMPKQSSHPDVLSEEILRADEDRYEEIPIHRETSEREMRERAAAWLRDRGWEPSWKVERELPFGRWQDHWNTRRELVQTYRKVFPQSNGPYLPCCSHQMIHEAVLSGDEVRYWEAPPGVSF